MKKLAIITTHPIQYNAPLFREMTQAKKFEVKVFYTWGETVLLNKFDPGFGKMVEWDVDLLEGYTFEFVKNISKRPGSHHNKGIDNPNLIAVVEKWGADAILIFGWNFRSHLKAMRYFHKKIPVLFRGDSTLLDKQSTIKRILRRLVLKSIYQHVDFFLYVGQANKAYFKSAGVKENQLIFAPHAIDLSFFKKDVTASSLRITLGIQEDDLVFLFAGKLDAKKDPLLLLQSFSSIAKPTSHLVIAGDGELREEVESNAQGKSNVHLLAFQNQTQMPALYNAADVFVLPSKGPNETWGLAINEAMACGCSIISSDKCGGASDLVLEGKNGFIFKATNAVELGNRMDWFQDNRNQLDAFSQQSVQHIQSFNYSKMIDSLDLILAQDV